MSELRLQTKVVIPNSENRYDFKSRFTCLGSCFADEIGQRLQTRSIPTSVNPLGTIFNPEALVKIASRAIEGIEFRDNEFFLHQELWRHFFVHSNLANTDLKKSVERANQALFELGRSLSETNLLIVSFGTAWSYRARGTQEVISHNHKLPLSNFEKRLLTPDQISGSFCQLLSLFKKRSINLGVCLTVSPVRHLRDGLHENNLSKASLLLAAHQIEQSHENCIYFPAYEILLDQLRDYRFYAEDLAHPSRQAVDHIWAEFASAHLSDECQKTVREIESLNTALEHRPHHPDTYSYKVFKQGLQGKIAHLSNQGIKTEALRQKLENLP